MKKLYFATTNKGKLKEAREILGAEVVGTPLEIDEIQSLDPKEVAIKKAKAYYQGLKKPVFVEDISVFIKALDGLPGPYIDAFIKSLGNAGILRVLKDAKDRAVYAQATIVYKESTKNEKVFIGKVSGSISKSQRGTGFGWDPIFIPKGYEKTFGEMNDEGNNEKNKLSMRGVALRKMKKWLIQNNKI